MHACVRAVAWTPETAPGVAYQAIPSTYTGKLYLLHFDRPLGHARHYLGFAARNVEQRLADHAIGRGARLTRVAIERGITWRCVWMQPGDRSLERAYKANTVSMSLCPICRRGWLDHRNELARARRAARRMQPCAR